MQTWENLKFFWDCLSSFWIRFFWVRWENKKCHLMLGSFLDCISSVSWRISLWNCHIITSFMLYNSSLNTSFSLSLCHFLHVIKWHLILWMRIFLSLKRNKCNEFFIHSELIIHLKNHFRFCFIVAILYFRVRLNCA